MEETNGDLDLVKDEFGQRLHELERKLQNALREKEMVKKQLVTTQEEIQNRWGEKIVTEIELYWSYPLSIF